MRAHFLRVRRGGRAPAGAPPSAPLPASAPPPPGAAEAAAGAQSSSRPATPPPPPQPRPARSRGSRVGAESAPGGEYADPSPAPLPWITGSHRHPKEGKKNNKKKTTRTQLRVPSLPPPAGPRGARAPRDPAEARFVPKPVRPWPDVSPSTPVGAPDVRRPLPPPRRVIPRGGTPPLCPDPGVLLYSHLPRPGARAAPAPPSPGPSCSPAAGAEGNHPPPPPSFAFWGRQVQCPRGRSWPRKGGPGLGKGQGSRVLAPDGWLSPALVGTGLPAEEGGWPREHVLSCAPHRAVHS